MVGIGVVGGQVVLDQGKVVAHVGVIPGRVIEHGRKVVEVLLRVGDIMQHGIVNLGSLSGRVKIVDT